MTTSSFALSLELDRGETAFEPGATLAGVAVWSVSGPLSAMELRLKWTSRGQGGRDIKIARTVALPDPLPSERRPFVVAVPPAPFSFQGTLISLDWQLELVALPAEEKAIIPIIIAPGRRALALEATPTPEA